MKVSILFSGGKDSALAASLLSKFFEVELVTCTFGLLSNWQEAEEVARKLKFSFKVLKLSSGILEQAAQQVVKDGFPNNGIKYIHQEALEILAKDPPLTAGQAVIIADGVRRDDRVPVLSLSEIRRLEDKHKIHYLQPLMGYGRKAVDLLIKEFFVVREYKSDSFIGAEYEFELREIIKREYGIKKVSSIFPRDHTHSIVDKVIK